MQTYPSKLIEEAVNQISGLPGIGKKTALRLVLYILKEDISFAEGLGNAVIKMRNEIKYCKVCHNVSDTDICNICSNPRRDKSIICVVENLRDILAIENTNQFNGVYHILGGIISPIEGIGPEKLNIESLEKKIAGGGVKELIMALSTTVEGDTTIFYLHKRFKDYNISVSVIARGVSIGDDLEYIDEITLGRSIINRVKYNTET